MSWDVVLAGLTHPSVLAAAVTGLLGLIAAALTLQGRRSKEALSLARESREQVTNSHKTNLRDDLDRVLSLAELLLDGQELHQLALAEHGQALGQIRTDLDTERRERQLVAARLDTHLDIHRR